MQDAELDILSTGLIVRGAIRSQAWSRRLVEKGFLAVLDRQSTPRIWRMAAADRSALAMNPATGLSAIRSA